MLTRVIGFVLCVWLAAVLLGGCAPSRPRVFIIDADLLADCLESSDGPVDPYLFCARLKGEPCTTDSDCAARFGGEY